MSNQVVLKEEVKSMPASQGIASPMQLMQVAIESDAGLDKLEKLMALQERWEANQAKKSFFDAMSLFQSKIPVIKKLKTAHNCKYAPLGDIMPQIKTPLAECGLSVRFEQEHTNLIIVTCIVTHRDGHSEKTTMHGSPDTSGSKNSIQSIGSTVTYLQRYTLTGALGITTADEDVDGRLPVDKSLTIGGDKKLLDIIKKQGKSTEEFFKWASSILKKNIASIDDLSIEQIEWFINRLEGKK